MVSRPQDTDASELTAVELDDVLRTVAAQRNGQDHRIGELLLRAEELEVARLHGYGSLSEYCERVFGFGPRAVEDRLRVARALRELPHLSERSFSGEIVFAVLREVCRVATADNEAEWIDAIAGKTSREVQRMVAGRQLGERPSDPQEPDLVPRRVSFEVSPEVYALVMRAREQLTQELGSHVDDSRFVREIVLTYLSGGGHRDAGRAAYQIAITVDEQGRGRMKAGSESVPVSPATLERARCDAQQLGRVDCAGTAERASQTIPPRVRRQVLRRHDGRCGVPGCRHHAFVEVHHKDPLSEGGTHDPELLIPLCTAHHDAIHRGQLEVRGRYSVGFTFLHADGTPYGSTQVSAQRSRVMTQAFEVLRAMGWKERETRTMLDAVRTRVQDDVLADETVEETVENVVKRALRAASTDWATRGRAAGMVREVGEPYERCAWVSDVCQSSLPGPGAEPQIGALAP